MPKLVGLDMTRLGSDESSAVLFLHFHQTSVGAISQRRLEVDELAIAIVSRDLSENVNA